MDNMVRYRRKEVLQKQVDTLVGLCQGIVADGEVNQRETEVLRNWLEVHRVLLDEPMIQPLYERLSEMLEDGVLDKAEQKELLGVLSGFGGEPTEGGEYPKATTLPVDKPQPPIEFEGRTFALTGTFLLGKRKDCELVVGKLGGRFSKGITKSLDYLVIGTYVTDSWKHESFGNKIIKAAEYREGGVPLAILTEEHWVEQFPVAPEELGIR